MAVITFGNFLAVAGVFAPTKSLPMSATIIQIRDYQPKKTDAELREQAQKILAMSLDPSMIGAEFGADTAPSEYTAPDNDCA